MMNVTLHRLDKSAVAFNAKLIDSLVVWDQIGQPVQISIESWKHAKIVAANISQGQG